MNPIIEINNLTCRYRHTLAVENLDLSLAPGSVFAFLGPNGAGKTTTIKAMMGLIRPSAGDANVLGTSSDKLGREEFERIGYVSENQQQHEWMTIRQLMDYCRPFYPTWDEAFCQDLLKQYQLPLDRQLKHLSRGMKMKAILISSIAYRPELLVLDEPFSGLDPLVREEFIEGMLELTEQEKWTIFISSHDIDEVERLADTVGIINDGRLAVSESVESLQQRFRKVEITAKSPLPTQLPAEWLNPKTVGHRLGFTCSDFTSESAIRDHLDDNEAIIEAEAMSLRDIYLVLAKGFVRTKSLT